VVRDDVLDCAQELGVSALGQLGFELGRLVEVILDRPFTAAGDENQVRHARGHRFLDGVLDERLVDDRHHFLGARLRRRQEARAHARDGKYGFGDFIHEGAWEG
jgi:hypothetical protein